MRNAIDLAEKAFLQANREHKQEQDEHDIKLQINMRLMISEGVQDFIRKD